MPLERAGGAATCLAWISSYCSKKRDPNATYQVQDKDSARSVQELPASPIVSGFLWKKMVLVPIPKVFVHCCVLRRLQVVVLRRFSAVSASDLQ